MLRPAGPPGMEPLTPAEVAEHRRIDDAGSEDVFLVDCIRAAREYAEMKTGRALVDRDWELVLDSFPRGPIEIRKVPIRPESVVVTYINTEGELVTMGAADLVVVHGEPARIAPLDGCWPSTRRGRIGAVVVRFRAGPAAGGVPEILRSAMRLHIGDMYEHREETITGTIVTPRRAVDAIYDDYLVGRRYA